MHRNVADWERIASVAVGAALLLMAVRRRQVSPGLAGVTLVARGLSGRCPVYAATGLSSRRSLLPRAVTHRRLITGTITINRPASDVIDAWQNLESIPESLSSLELLEDVEARQPSAAISFRELTRGGCEIAVSIAFDDTTGPAAAALRKLTGRSPSAQLHEDLRKFKALVETGEVPIGAMPAGRRTIAYRALKAVTA